MRKPSRRDPFLLVLFYYLYQIFELVPWWVVPPVAFGLFALFYWGLPALGPKDSHGVVVSFVHPMMRGLAWLVGGLTLATGAWANLQKGLTHYDEKMRDRREKRRQNADR